MLNFKLATPTCVDVHSTLLYTLLSQWVSHTTCPLKSGQCIWLSTVFHCSFCFFFCTAGYIKKPQKANKLCWPVETLQPACTAGKLERNAKSEREREGKKGREEVKATTSTTQCTQSMHTNNHSSSSSRRLLFQTLNTKSSHQK